MATKSGENNATTITVRKFKIEGDRNSYEQCLDYIYEQKLALDRGKYGVNKQSLIRVLDIEQTRAQEIKNFGREVDKVLNNEQDADKRTNLEEAYKNLKELSEKKLGCTEVMYQVANMERDCGALSRTIDKRAVTLVTLEERDSSAGGAGSDVLEGLNKQGFLAATARDCIFGLKDNWQWLVTLVKCTDIHLKNSSAYHQFFHELDETRTWMLSDLSRLFKAHEVYQLTGDYKDAQKLLQEIEDVLVALRQWEARADRLWTDSASLVPVQYRTNPLLKPLPARSLADYTVDDVIIREGEDLLLLETSNPEFWRVKNCRGEEIDVPPLIILIPGPFKEAVDAVVQLRLQLLATWTDTIKRVGQRLIHFLLLVFKPDYNPDQISLMKSIGQYDKQELNRVMDMIEDLLRAHWNDHEGFQDLQERLLSLRMILDEESDGKIKDENILRAIVVQITSLEKVMDKYKDLWQDWEGYKNAVESSKSPELMLVVDKWEQLQFVSRAYFSKYWKTNLKVDELDGPFVVSQESFSIPPRELSEKEIVVQNDQLLNAGVEYEDEDVVEEEIIEEQRQDIHQANMDEIEVLDLGLATETKTAETEQLSSAESEENRTFIIKSVINPVDGKEISLQQAIMEGIIKPDDGIYYNCETGEGIPIPAAMSAGKIKVEFMAVKRTEEKKTTIGIITVKTVKEAVRPYSIKSVRDTVTGLDVSSEEATKLDILVESRGVFRDRKNGTQMLVAEAVEKKLIEVEYLGDAPEPEVVSRTYAVRGVTDRKENTTIPFQEAVKRGIINKETGAYKDTLTGEDMYVGDAIMRGFLKARVMTEDEQTKLDVDPRNKMMVDKTETIRRRLIQPLSVISAFKKAASSGANKPKLTQSVNGSHD